MSVDIVKVSKQLYVGFPSNPSNGVFPLVFATPFDKDDSAFKNRKSSVDKWSAQNVYDPKSGTYVTGLGTQKYINNDPQKGFKIHDSVSRWSTQNKFFNVQDPRGFTLQISTECLADVIEQTTIINGVIQDEMVWARRGGQNVLIPITSDAYKMSQQTPVTPGQLKVNDIVVVNKEEWNYQGKKFITVINKTSRSYSAIGGASYKQGQKRWQNTYAVYIPKTALHAFIDVEAPSRGRTKALFSKSPKIQALLKNDPAIALPNAPFECRYGGGDNFEHENYVYMFDTLDEARSFDVQSIIEQLPKSE